MIIIIIIINVPVSFFSPITIRYYYILGGTFNMAIPSALIASPALPKTPAQCPDPTGSVLLCVVSWSIFLQHALILNSLRGIDVDSFNNCRTPFTGSTMYNNICHLCVC